MCFSASVSFSMGTLLITTGAATTLGNKKKEQRMIAAMPLIFGIQQVAEGLVWQSLGDPTNFTQQVGITLFIAIALIIWPSWLPWSLYQLEVHEKRKRILKVLGFFGFGVSILAIGVLHDNPVQAYSAGHSMGYAFPNVQKFWPDSIDFLLYDTPTVLPFFVSSLRTVKKAGYLALASLVATQIINQQATTSVWCFFAALISFYIAVNVLVKQEQKLA